MSHAHHDSLKTNPTEPIVTVDEESAIVAANPAACRALGASEESLRGAPFLGRVGAAARSSVSAMLDEGLRGQPGEAALTLRCGPSEDRPFLVRVVPVMRESDRPRLLLVLREPDRQAPRVMVIDDDAAIRTTIRRSLELGGYRVVEATSGRDALAQLHAGAGVDLVVTDLKMANGSGGWLLAQLAYDHPELLGRTVVMAGDAGSAGAAHVASRWRCPVLGKPFARDALLAALASLSGTP